MPLFVLIGARGPLPSGGEILPTLSVTSLLRPLTLLSVILSLSNVNVFVVDEIFRGLLSRLCSGSKRMKAIGDGLLAMSPPVVPLVPLPYSSFTL